MRVERDLTLKAFAEMLGVGYNSLWKWENDEVRPSGQGKIKLELLLDRGKKNVKQHN